MPHSLKEVMSALRKAGSEQTRKTWRRHGAEEPMFGVKFGDLAKLVKKIGVDHELAVQLWDTGNADARTLALKLADPARLSAADLDRWVAKTRWGMHLSYLAQLASETPHAAEKASAWSAKSDARIGLAGWSIVGQMALRDATTPDAWFHDRLAEIENRIQAVPDGLRHAMNGTLIAIGGRSPALRATACAAAKRLGKIEVDHGDTACKTPDAVPYIDKMWARAKSKGFATPAAQERDREPPRLRC